MYYFYIVRCKDNSLYCGFTTNLERRVEEHNSHNYKSAKYTRAKGPVKLVYFEQFNSKQEAMKREYEVKQWRKEQKENLILTQHQIG
ncbi:MAG TPA: GIY-YIG nuclease family protein [Candidatus Woesebacteria bacterium]|nr:GIY-YIG nuclease family protein [Candidatus Woesebacteria bacterium]